MNLTPADLRALQARDRAITPSRKESEIQSAILSYLKTVPGVAAWRNNSRVVRMPGAGGRDRLVRFGGMPGAPDIMGWLEWPQVITDCRSPLVSSFKPKIARVLGIEVKRPGQRTTTQQEAFGSLLNKAGGVWFVATCVQDVVNALVAVSRVAEPAGGEG